MFFLNSPQDQPLRSAPPDRDTLHFAVYPNRSDWSLLSLSSPRGAEIMPQTATPQSALSLECGSAQQRHFQIRKKAKEGGFHAGQVTIKTVSLSRLKGRAMLMLGLRVRADLILTEIGGLNCLQIPSASPPICAPLHFELDKRCLT